MLKENGDRLHVIKATLTQCCDVFLCSSMSSSRSSSFHEQALSVVRRQKKTMFKDRSNS